MRYAVTLLVFMLLAAAPGLVTAQTPTPTAAGTATPTPTPSGPGFSGTAPAPGSIGLLVTARAVHRSDLTNDFAAKGCAVGSIGLLTSGVWSLYIVGAPAVVNQGFPVNLGATAPFFVRCGEGAPPPLTIDAGTKGPPSPGAIASGIPATAAGYRFRVAGLDLTNIMFRGSTGAPPCPPDCRLPARIALGAAWATFSRGGGQFLESQDGPVLGPSLFIDGTAPAGPYPFTLTFSDGRTLQGVVNHTP